MRWRGYKDKNSFPPRPNPLPPQGERVTEHWMPAHDQRRGQGQALWCRSGMRGFGKFRVLLAPEAVWALEVLGVAGDDDLFSNEAGDAE